MSRTLPKTDKQLAGLKISDLVKKRKLDQALNAKEFARLAGISYSQARQWFRLPEFPAIRGVVFWSDFVEWRRAQCGLTEFLERIRLNATYHRPEAHRHVTFSGRAAQILAQAGIR